MHQKLHACLQQQGGGSGGGSTAYDARYDDENGERYQDEEVVINT